MRVQFPLGACGGRRSGFTPQGGSLHRGARGISRAPGAAFGKPTGRIRGPSRKRVRSALRCGFESHGFRLSSSAAPRWAKSSPPRFSDRQCVWRTGPWSNRKTPAWHVGDPGAIPGGSTCGRLVVDDPVVQRRQHPAYNRKTMVRVHPGSFGLTGRFLSPGTPPDTGVKRVWHRSSGRTRRVPGRCLSSWCSPECTLPCHGGGRGFKSHRGR